MNKPHNYQSKREQENPVVDWYTESLFEGTNTVKVKTTAIKTVLCSDEDGHFEGVCVNSQIVEDSFQIKTKG